MNPIEVFVVAVSSLLVVFSFSYFLGYLLSINIQDKLTVLSIAMLHNVSRGDFNISYNANGTLDTTNGLKINNYSINYNAFKPIRCKFNSLIIRRDEIICLSN